MTGTVTKGDIFRQDFDNYDGVSTESSRIDSTGGTVTGLKVGNTVDVLTVYGDGTNRTDATLSAAKSAVGTSSVSFSLAPGEWTISNDTTIPANVTLELPRGVTLNIASGKTLTINGDLIVGEYGVFSGDGVVRGIKQSLNPKWWGATWDEVTNDSAEIQKCFDALLDTGDLNTSGSTITWPLGFPRITSPINIPNFPHRVVGHGVGSGVVAIGTTAFTIKGSATTISQFSDMQIIGDNTANMAAFDTTPTSVSSVVSNYKWQRLRIRNFPRPFIVPNAQLCLFEDLHLDATAGGRHFYIAHTDAGQACNSNRVVRCRFGGANTDVIDFTPSGTSRSTNWKFYSCDFQQANTNTPQLTLPDSNCVVTDSEFENSTHTHLIEVTSASNDAVALNTRIDNNIFTGVGANGAIYITGAHTTKPNVIAIGNDAGNAGKVAVFASSGSRPSIFIGNVGTVDTSAAGRFVLKLGGSSDSSLSAINFAFGNDSIGAKLTALSASDTLGKNLAGTVTFAGAATAAVTFAGALQEPDAFYNVIIDADVNETFWTTAKATSGFTINSSNGASTATVGWMLVRY